MKKWDTELLRGMVQSALEDFSRAHPDQAVPPESWGSISKRAARRIFREFQQRFGEPDDRFVDADRVKRNRRTAEGE